MKQASGEAGFTLVELLVSLSLLALMMTYAVNAFSTLRQMNRISDQAAAQEEADAARAYLSQEIADLRVLFEAEDNGAQTLVFGGEPHSLLYIASSDGTRETGGLIQVRLALNAGAELIAERQLMQTEPVGPVIRVILLRQVASLDFAYAGLADAGGELTWQDTWPKGNALPAAVRIAVGFAAGDSRRWPESLLLVRTAR